MQQIIYLTNNKVHIIWNRKTLLQERHIKKYNIMTLNVTLRLYLNVNLTFTDFILAGRTFQMTQPALYKVVIFVEGWS